MGSWERFDETWLPDEKDFYSKLNLEDISDEDYTQAQKFFKELKLKNLGDCHDLDVQSDILLLVGVFENFRNKCIEIYEIDPAHFFVCPRIAMDSLFKKTGEKSELLTDIDLLLMVEKVIGGGICHPIHRYAEANNRYLKYYNEEVESSYLKYLYANNLYGWAMSRKLLVNGVKWVEELSQFNEDFITNYYEDSNCLIFIVIYHFNQKERKSKNVISLLVKYITKKTMSFI